MTTSITNIFPSEIECTAIGTDRERCGTITISTENISRLSTATYDRVHNPSQRFEAATAHLQQGRVEPWRLLKVLEQPPRGCHEDVHLHDRYLLLAELLLAPRDQTRRQLVVLPELAKHLEYLEGELSRWGYHQRGQPVSA